jgi:hypothetical protein
LLSFTVTILLLAGFVSGSRTASAQKSLKKKFLPLNRPAPRRIKESWRASLPRFLGTGTPGHGEQVYSTVSDGNLTLGHIYEYLRSERNARIDLRTYKLAGRARQLHGLRLDAERRRQRIRV